MGVRSLTLALSVLLFAVVIFRAGEASVANSASVVALDDFDSRFTGKTLRFDYFHTGTATEEHISMDEVRLEGDWPGNRTGAALVDESALGYYLFAVVDPADERIVYSRGFDSIFGEWQTTAEATKVWRTFHESQRFPEPRATVQLVLKRRTPNGEWQPIYCGSLARRGTDVNRAARPPQGEVWTVFDNGPPAKKLDLLVLGDGYTASETKKFHDDVVRLTGVLFDTEPFRSHKEDFNVRAIDLASRESGITDPRRGLWRDSPLGFRSNAFGIDRYALSLENKAIREAAAAAAYDALVVISNTRKHAGGGIYNLWANAPADSPTAPYVFVHELGHSLAGLDDEYYNAEVAYLLPERPSAEPWRPNVTALLDALALKWRDLVQEDTPIPTPWNQVEYDRLTTAHQGRVRDLESRGAGAAEINHQYVNVKQTAAELLARERFAGKTGAFEGAGYSAKGLYRSEVDCIMFSQNRGAFCRVCARAIEQAIRAHCD
jgi:hypothetical protein